MLRLAVNKGDIINASVFAKYEEVSTTNTDAVTTIAAALINAISGTSSGVLSESGLNTINNNYNSGELLGSSAFPVDDTAPRAFLNLVFIADNGEIDLENGVSFAFDQINSSASQYIGESKNQNFDELQVADFKVPAKGYIYVYLSNESEYLTRVYFDDLKVRVKEGLVLQSDDYYPFGLTFKSWKPSITSKENRFLYNDGAERINALDLGVDFTSYRTYDPSLGRWWQQDLVYKFHESPYSWVTNNPIRFNDPLGLDTLEAVTIHGKRIYDNQRNTSSISLLFLLPALETAAPEVIPAAESSVLVLGGAALMTIVGVLIPTSTGKGDAWTNDDDSELNRLLNKETTGTITDQEKQDLDVLLDKAKKFGRGPYTQFLIKVVIAQKSADHIFRNAPGHFREDTEENRRLLESVANDRNSYLGNDKYGNSWHARTQNDGTQIWTQSRNGEIRNGGINKTPRTFNRETGLSSPTK